MDYTPAYSFYALISYLNTSSYIYLSAYYKKRPQSFPDEWNPYA